MYFHVYFLVKVTVKNIAICASFHWFGRADR